MTDIDIISPDGIPGTIPQEDKEMALSQGYSLPTSGPTTGPSEADLHPDVEMTPEQEAEVPHIAKTPLINKSTGEEELVDEDDANQKLLNKTHSIPDYVKEVPVVQLSDNKLGSMPREDVESAIAPGGNYRLATSEDQDNFEQEKAIATELEKKGGTGLKEYFQNLDRDALMKASQVIGHPLTTEEADKVIKTGVLGKVYGNVDALLTELGRHGTPVYDVLNKINPVKPQVEEAITQEVKKYPAGYYAGAVAGEVFQAVSAGAASEAAATALGLERGPAKILLESAIWASPSVTADLINKNPGAAAEDLAITTGVNFLTHGLLSNFTAPTAKELAKNAEVATQRAILDKELQSENSQKIAKEVFGMKDPREIEKLQEVLPNIIKDSDITIKDTNQEIVDKLQNLSKEKSQLPDKILQLADKEPITQNLVTQHMGEVRKTLNELVKTQVGPANKIVSKILTPIALQVDAMAKAGTLASLQDGEKFLASQIKGDTFKKEVAQRAYNIFLEGKTRAEDAIAKQIANPEITQAIQKQRGIALLNQWIETAEKNLSGADKESLKNPLSETIKKVSHNPLTWILAHTIGHHLSPILYGAKIAASVWQKATGAKATSAFGDYLSHQILANQAAQDMKISISTEARNLISNLTSQSVRQAKQLSGGINSFLPNNGTGLSESQKVKTLQEAIKQAQNPNNFAATTESLVGPLKADGLHAVAQDYTDHQLRLMKVIQSVLPADPAMNQAHPFMANVKTQEISPATKMRYDRAMTIAADPRKLFDMIKSNMISDYDVAIASATNPNTLQKMRIELMNEIVKSKPDLSYQHKLSIGIMMGTNIDESANQLPILQSVYVAPTVASQMSEGKGGSKLSAKSQERLQEAPLTTSQEVQEMPQ